MSVDALAGHLADAVVVRVTTVPTSFHSPGRLERNERLIWWMVVLVLGFLCSFVSVSSLYKVYGPICGFSCHSCEPSLVGLV